MPGNLANVLGEQGLLNLLNFEYDAVNYIYNLPPQQNNLFWAGNFSSARLVNGETIVKPQENPEAGGNAFTNAQFRIQGIRWELPHLEFEENKQLRVEFVKGVAIPHEVTIKWLEDSYHSVRQYHLNWLKSWYDRDKDCLIVGPENKFRHCDILIFHYVNAVEGDVTETSGAPLEVLVPEVIAGFRLNGLMPKSFGPVSVDYSEDGNGEVASYTYSVLSTDLSYEYTDASKFWKPDAADETNRLKDSLTQHAPEDKIRRLT